MLLLLVLLAVGLSPTLAAAQYPACNDAEVVFVGRAEPPITFHVSGERAIERARQNLERVKEEVARERAALDVKSQFERSAEFALRLIAAETELDMRRTMYPPPFDITFVPFSVAQPLRGVRESTVLVHERHVRFTTGESYLVFGTRTPNRWPQLPDTVDFSHISEYVDALTAEQAASVPSTVQFLEETKSVATIFGSLSVKAWHDGPRRAMAGVRVIASSERATSEAITTEDGAFRLSVPPGRVRLAADLPASLTIVTRRGLTLDLRQGTCAEVQLAVGPNVRLTGRIASASGDTLKNVKVVLESADVTHSHAPRFEADVAEDGSFEILGVVPGAYLLSASVEQAAGKNVRRLRTYYPGTNVYRDAVPIVVDEKGSIDGLEFLVTTE